MKTFLASLFSSVLLTGLLVMLLGGVYPLVVWAGGQLLFPTRANGSLLTDADGTVRGSALVAQGFTGDGYFHPRPSSAGTGYDAASSSGSNLGPTSKKLADTIQADVATYRKINRLAADASVPADAVTRSASGLDPHVSLANARLQAPRVAQARQLPLAGVEQLINHHLSSRDLGLFGEAGVNVLLLNLALDAGSVSAP